MSTPPTPPRLVIHHQDGDAYYPLRRPNVVLGRLETADVVLDDPTVSRIVFIDRNVRVGVPAGVGERLRVQSAGGAVYLRASEPIEPTRLQLQDADTGALILLDIAAEPPKDGEAELEPVRIVEGNSTPARYGNQSGGADETPARAQDQAGTRAARRRPSIPKRFACACSPAWRSAIRPGRFSRMP